MTTTQTSNSRKSSISKEIQANPENTVVTKVKANETKVSTNKQTKATNKSETKGDEMISVNNAEKTTGRNFYAVKPNKSGKDVAYAFERIAERNDWMTKNDDAKPVTALEVYQMLNKSSHDALIANRNKRVYKVKADDSIDVKKGQRLIRC